ncbi:tRNA (adenosine(37)-N6)-threonylcarbamoyltransferase complex dimerization subunit type 1 TsaB [Veronia pacifica]|uniref:tRNA threonylcarbamoyladenosine biosynthesis protein TsaB n=1 Tax=Veronia pacifica TaxID=1080227 RepID=A0A1C3ERI4_9GAMM|nr:tRNA (adenosine(37)-N6)-threonylcarbamoyltransferase complex dimerization subunit type 1 TsaB [Veronia pacifica]ODA35853.1 tRNA N6-adenosine(37)-N6-threonylcarbamoyltransferase complex dimerization subunit TsaB [Veronia pacifica]
MTSKILAVDTATENCSVALKIGDDVIARCEMAPREHTTKVLPMVDEVLAEGGITLNQLDALAFGRGPGSFTGVRIGIGIAQGLAFGADLPMVGISTLAAMAEQVHRLQGGEQVISAIDARMNEIYVAQFTRQNNGDWLENHPEAVTRPEQFCPENLDGQWLLAGTGWQAYPDLAERLNLSVSKEGVLFPESQDMVALADFALSRGEAVAAELASPIYLRDTVTWKKLPGRE